MGYGNHEDRSVPAYLLAQKQARLDDLWQQVSLAIVELAEANSKVSRLEEEIAGLNPYYSFEGRTARRCEVRTAVDAEDYDRVKELVSRFLAEEGVDEKLINELRFISYISLLLGG